MKAAVYDDRADVRIESVPEAATPIALVGLQAAPTELNLADLVLREVDLLTTVRTFAMPISQSHSSCWPTPRWPTRRLIE